MLITFTNYFNLRFEYRVRTVSLIIGQADVNRGEEGNLLRHTNTYTDVLEGDLVHDNKEREQNTDCRDQDTESYIWEEQKRYCNTRKRRCLTTKKEYKIQTVVMKVLRTVDGKSRRDTVVREKDLVHDTKGVEENIDSRDNDSESCGWEEKLECGTKELEIMYK